MDHPGQAEIRYEMNGTANFLSSVDPLRRAAASTPFVRCHSELAIRFAASRVAAKIV